MKKLIIITTLIFAISLIISPKAQAVTCAFDNTSSVSVGSSCTTLASSTDGPDAGTGSTNTALLTVSSGTLTLGGNSILALGSMVIGTDGFVAFGSGAQIKVGTPLYALDVDGDKFASALVFYITTDTNRIRRNTLTSVTEVDCNDNANSANNCCLAPEYC